MADQAYRQRAHITGVPYLALIHTLKWISRKLSPGKSLATITSRLFELVRKKSTLLFPIKLMLANAQSEAIQYYTIKSKMKIRTFTALADLDVDQECHEQQLQIKKN